MVTTLLFGCFVLTFILFDRFVGLWFIFVLFIAVVFFRIGLLFVGLCFVFGGSSFDCLLVI